MLKRHDRFLEGAHKIAAQFTAGAKALEYGVVDKIAERLLERCQEEPPIPPIQIPAKDDYVIQASGAAFVGKRLVAITGGDTPKPWRVSSDPSTITIHYSVPKPAKKKAKVFYTLGGGRFFDYVPYQHTHHRFSSGWISEKMEPERVSGMIGAYVTNALRRVMKLEGRR